MYNNRILGGIVGDIIGSTRERENVKIEDFELFPQGSRFTDDTVMTLAVAQWLMTDLEHTEAGLIVYAVFGSEISKCRLWWHISQMARIREPTTLRKF